MKKFEDLQIAVAGTGYVGLSIATLLAQNHQVTAVDVIPEKVEKTNRGICPIQDEYIEKMLPQVIAGEHRDPSSLPPLTMIPFRIISILTILKKSSTLY